MDIPGDTIARLMHEIAFEDKEHTRMSEEVVSKIQQYIDVFAKEAVVRSLEAYEERVEMQDLSQKEEVTHEDLECVAGLLLLDM
ncbi:hypothetical protein RNJ44_04793 [Nakaseomyces bracarensis]|uniref:Uncharacterized protein n=1 Tax=Nakaseomyces bracarensis TaxID=273131 RepID=A0ABR4NW80_9SACH